MNIYQKRRAAIATELKKLGGGIAVLPTAPEQSRSRDTNFSYRPDSYFYYLTGFSEPDAWLTIDSSGKTTIFCRPKDPNREIWDGTRLGPDAAVKELGVSKAVSVEVIYHQLPKLLIKHDRIWYPFATHEWLEPLIDGALQRARSMGKHTAPVFQHDLCEILDEMRLIKDDHEIAILRRAGEISAVAHIKAMKLSSLMTNHPVEFAPKEYHLEAELLLWFRRFGSEYPAYTSIVAGGINATILHARASKDQLKNGELCLIDAGCELEGYASDITRTFPINGRFTKPQRTLYDIVLKAQLAAIEAVQPGNRFSDPHTVALRILIQGMLDTGLLSKKKHGEVDDIIENGIYKQFYMHRTSHWMGMDVHDCGSYIEPTEITILGSRILKPGMVLTIEPGLYVRSHKDVPKEFWNIGIRIEDDVLVTTTGHEILSNGVPVEPDEIQALMK